MPIPVQLRNRIVALLDAAYESFLASEPINAAEHFEIAGRRVKVHVVGRDLDHPKEVVLRIVWKPPDDA
jgi:hypothetical protein